MVDTNFLRRLVLRFRSSSGGSNLARFSISAFHRYQYHYSTETLSDDKIFSKNVNNSNNKQGKWFTLPPFTSRINGSEVGKALSVGSRAASAETTALKWILQCCPGLPRSLVQKLFRLRQVRRESTGMEHSDCVGQVQESKLKRVAAKDMMNCGDRIFLPITVQELPSKKQECPCTEEEVNFIRSLELYKDAAIVVVNKPPGMPVQGGIGIKRSLDELAASCLTYEFPDPPRLVHRLDRDSSGILVMGRTQISATVLHSLFREKTFGASKDEIQNRQRALQRRYWALVIGCPRRSKGLISAPLGKVSTLALAGCINLLCPYCHKFPSYCYGPFIYLPLSPTCVRFLINCQRGSGPSYPPTLMIHCNLLFQVVVDNGKSDRITVVENAQAMSAQHAITEYRVIGPSSHGYTWLELSPITGRKHQLRVHCAEVLGTPMVGDYKYGWQAHKRWEQLHSSALIKNLNDNLPKEKTLPFGIDLEDGSIFDKHPRLHLHCKEMVLPDISQALKHVQLSIDHDLSKLKRLDLVAPMPSHMQRSWDLMNS